MSKIRMGERQLQIAMSPWFPAACPSIKPAPGGCARISIFQLLLNYYVLACFFVLMFMLVLVVYVDVHQCWHDQCQNNDKQPSLLSPTPAPFTFRPVTGHFINCLSGTQLLETWTRIIPYQDQAWCLKLVSRLTSNNLNIAVKCKK